MGTGPHFLYVSEICINKNESLTETIRKLTDLISHKHCESMYAYNVALQIISLSF